MGKIQRSSACDCGRTGTASLSGGRAAASRCESDTYVRPYNEQRSHSCPNAGVSTDSESSAPAPLPSPFLFPGGAGCLWRLTYGFPPSSFTFVLAPSTYRKTCLPAADADTRFCSPQHGMTPAIVYGFPPSSFRPPRTEKRACPRPVVYPAGRQEGVWFQESRACDCVRSIEGKLSVGRRHTY